MQSDLVSVIIPVYNAEKYIVECIDSVLTQTHTNLEVIIVNDGSTDHTLHLINLYKDERLLIVNQENKGCSNAKNTGLLLANGAFIQYLDADDILSINKIEQQVKSLQDLENSMAVCKTLIIQESIDQVMGEVDTELIKSEGSGIEFLLRLLGSHGVSGMVQPNAYLITRNIANKIGGWNEKISPSPDEDGEYFARALCCADKVIFTAGINYYRKPLNSSSLSKQYSFDRANNLLKTVDLKFQHIFKLEKTNRTQKLYQLNISQVAYQFGMDYPELLNNSLNYLADYKYKKLIVNRPKLFSIISRILGFKFTVYLKKTLIKI